MNVELNEIQAYLSGRLLSCAEATFRILGLRLHQEWPPVVRLDLHLPYHNIVVFNPMDDDVEVEQQLPAATLAPRDISLRLLFLHPQLHYL